MEMSCSLANDRSLTRILIDNSTNDSLKSLNHFVNKVDWVDGLNQWTSQPITNKNNLNPNQFDFHQDIGLYLPKQQHHLLRSSTDFIRQPTTTTTTTITTNKLNSNSNQRRSFLFFSMKIKKNLCSECSSENSSRKVRFPLRQIQSKKCSESNVNEEKLQLLLNEQINRLMKRPTTNCQSKRIAIKIPSVDIKHQHFTSKSPIQSSQDTNSNNDKYSKLQQFIYSPMTTYQRQSPLILQQITTLGLSITPLEIYNSNQRRPSTQIGSRLSLSSLIYSLLFIHFMFRSNKFVLFIE